MGKQDNHSDSEDNIDEDFISEVDNLELNDESLLEQVDLSKNDQDKRAAEARRKIERIREERELRAQLDDIYFSDDD